jgi:hypothetical protein
MRLVTNLVAHVTMMDSPFDEFLYWRGTRRGSWPHGRGFQINKCYSC